MSRRLLVSLALLAGLLPVVSAPVAGAEGHEGFGAAMLRELNRVRGRHHLASVREDGSMSRGAAAHSRDMARHGYFAHGAWSGRVARASHSANDLGEVLGWLARGNPAHEAAGMVRAWLNSPEHRHVLLDGDFSRIGIGRATSRRGSEQTALYTVDFASPH
jgi:uncharacterized protein YkwD